MLHCSSACHAATTAAAAKGTPGPWQPPAVPAKTARFPPSHALGGAHSESRRLKGEKTAATTAAAAAAAHRGPQRTSCRVHYHDPVLRVFLSSNQGGRLRLLLLLAWEEKTASAVARALQARACSEAAYLPRPAAAAGRTQPFMSTPSAWVGPAGGVSNIENNVWE